MNISTIFTNNNENYLTIPAIRKFAENIPELKLGSSSDKQDMISAIEKYMNYSEENQEKVLDWLDYVCHEGIQDIHLTYAEVDTEISLYLNNIKAANDFIKEFISKDSNPHISFNKYDKNFRLINAYCESSKLGNRVVFVLCKKITLYDKVQKYQRDIDYPLIAEYYIDNCWLLLKAKSRSNMYIYTGKPLTLDTAESTTYEKQVKEAKNFLKNILRFDESAYNAEEKLKNKLFELLDQYTNTPYEIEEILCKQTDNINKISEHIKNLCGTQNTLYQDINDDVRNLFEKYLSIIWADRSIFTKDREAYPIKLNATDDEASKVEQVAGLSQPLQTKAVFFDNKKMLYKSKKCDNIYLKWKRLNNKYFTKDFSVSLSVGNKGICIIKFREYVVREDIENVLSKIIGI